MAAGKVGDCRRDSRSACAVGTISHAVAKVGVLAEARRIRRSTA